MFHVILIVNAAIGSTHIDGANICDVIIANFAWGSYGSPEYCSRLTAYVAHWMNKKGLHSSSLVGSTSSTKQSSECEEINVSPWFR